MQNNSDRWLEDSDEQHRQKRSNMFRKVFEDQSQTPDPNIIGTGETSTGPTECPDPIDKAYENLRESIYQFADTAGKLPRLIAVTSCYSGEGVSTVAVNLARSFTQNSTERILLVDTNCIDPSLHTTFGVDRSPGLCDIIENRIEPAKVIKQCGQSAIHVLPAGDCTFEPEQKYGTREFAAFLESLTNEFRFVIFDTPPLVSHELPVVKLGGIVDGVILVIEAERVRWEVVQHAKEKLVQGKAQILGAVLNKRPFHVPRWLYKTL